MKSSKHSGSESPGLIRKEMRYFSEAARRTIVKEIEDGLSKAEASRRYEVSLTMIYKWLEKYSVLYQKSMVKVVEQASDSDRLKRVEKELAEAYALLGRKDASVTYLEELIDRAGTELGVDIKKNFGTKR
jgi:transposase